MLKIEWQARIFLRINLNPLQINQNKIINQLKSIRIIFENINKIQFHFILRL